METLDSIRPIRTDEDHKAALAAMELLWNAEPGSPDYDRLDLLATLVEAYENKRWPLDNLDPVQALEAAIESGEHTRAELAAIIGQSRATEILGRQRPLTLNMIRAIERAWHVPAAILVKEYPLNRPR